MTDLTTSTAAAPQTRTIVHPPRATRFPPDQLTPAEVVIQEFARCTPPISIRELSRQMGIRASTITRWRALHPKGCDGVIPAWRHQAILLLSDKHGAGITANDLVFGRPKNDAMRSAEHGAGG